MSPVEQLSGVEAMSARIAKFAILFSLVLVTSAAQTVSAQLVLGRVGGVKIDAQGVIQQGFQKLDGTTLRQVQDYLNAADQDISKSTSMRMISLRGLEDAVNETHRTGKQLSAEVQYMAGLQRVEFVILSPETNDVILAGPAEGWKISAGGSIVGATTNRPVIHLEDFLVAMRTVDAANEGSGISVSIDPTEQGVKQLTQFYKQLAQGGGFDPSLEDKIENVLGDQQISLTGVPQDSRFANVLVAADYKMKRIAMGLEASPIKALPSFLDLAVNGKAKVVRMSPRFWMECNYQPLAKSDDGQVWQLRGQGVKTLCEETVVSRDGTERVKPNRFASKWADLMTKNFDDLAAADSTFGELRNVMDLSVIAALMKQQQMTQAVSLEIPAILGLTEVATTPAWTVPKTVPTQCSFARLTRSWLVTASGGVSVDSWGVAEKFETDAKVGEVAKVALKRNSDRWWWNASTN
ncbi:DUF1598 domain-containing protein [Mariniblastus sp.]|nr:DUF1598 domain-containing protein [Mariniblastus sp.]